MPTRQAIIESVLQGRVVDPLIKELLLIWGGSFQAPGRWVPRISDGAPAGFAIFPVVGLHLVEESLGEFPEGELVEGVSSLVGLPVEGDDSGRVGHRVTVSVDSDGRAAFPQGDVDVFHLFSGVLLLGRDGMWKHPPPPVISGSIAAVRIVFAVSVFRFFPVLTPTRPLWLHGPSNVCPVVKHH